MAPEPAVIPPYADCDAAQAGLELARELAAWLDGPDPIHSGRFLEAMQLALEGYRRITGQPPLAKDDHDG